MRINKKFVSLTVIGMTSIIISCGPIGKTEKDIRTSTQKQTEDAKKENPADSKVDTKELNDDSNRVYDYINAIFDARNPLEAPCNVYYDQEECAKSLIQMIENLDDIEQQVSKENFTSTNFVKIKDFLNKQRSLADIYGDLNKDTFDMLKERHISKIAKRPYSTENCISLLDEYIIESKTQEHSTLQSKFANLVDACKTEDL